MRRAATAFPYGIALVALACGALSGVPVEFVGELYLGELLLVPAGLLSLLAWRGARVLDDPLFFGVLAAGLITLSGYVLSDIVAGTAERDYLRGWARVALTLSNFAFLTMLLVNDRRLAAPFALGLGVARIGAAVSAGYSIVAHWKVAYAPGVSLVLLPAAAMLAPYAAGAGLLGFAALSIALDFRTLGGVMAIIGAVLLARARRPAERLAISRRFMRTALAACLAGGVLLLALEATDEIYGERRDSSNAGRKLDLVVGLPAILESPAIGRGSWYMSRELGAAARDVLVREVEGELARRQVGAVSVYFPHSQLVQCWYEGGILGLAFFLVYLAVAARALVHVALERPLDSATPLLLYFLLMGLWSLFMSPWGGSERLTIASALAAAFVTRAERRERAARPLRRPVAA